MHLSLPAALWASLQACLLHIHRLKRRGLSLPSSWGPCVVHIHRGNRFDLYLNFCPTGALRITQELVAKRFFSQAPASKAEVTCRQQSWPWRSYSRSPLQRSAFCAGNGSGDTSPSERKQYTRPPSLSNSHALYFRRFSRYCCMPAVII